MYDDQDNPVLDVELMREQLDHRTTYIYEFLYNENGVLLESKIIKFRKMKNDMVQQIDKHVYPLLLKDFNLYAVYVSALDVNQAISKADKLIKKELGVKEDA